MPGPWRPPTIETGRLILRAIDEADAPAIFRYCSNPNMTRFTLWDTHESMHDSAFFARDYARSRYLEEVPEPLGIALKDDPEGAVIGALGCFWVAKADGVMELGYNVGEAHWGRGIAVEASSALLTHVFETYEVHRVQARVIEGNDASARVAEKLGLRYEGTLRGLLYRHGEYRDVRMYSVLRPEWEERCLHHHPFRR